MRLQHVHDCMNIPRLMGPTGWAMRKVCMVQIIRSWHCVVPDQRERPVLSCAKFFFAFSFSMIWQQGTLACT